VSAEIGLFFLLAGWLFGIVLPGGASWKDDLALVFFLLFIFSVVVFSSVFFLNIPGFLIPPSMRTEKPLVRSWKNG
jgi:hypothetical protein